MAVLVAETNIKVDASGFKAHLDQYRRVMRMSVEGVLKQQARLVCQDVLSLELPYVGNGGGERGIRNDALEKGFNSLMADLNRIFEPLHQASWEDVAQKGDYAVFNAWISDSKANNKPLPDFLADQVTVGVGEWERFQSLYSKGQSHWGKNHDMVDLSTANASEGQIKSIHIAARGGKRVKDYKRNIKAYGKVHFVSGLEKKLTVYARQAKLRIGTLKGGFYAAGSQLGRIKANNWIKDNSGGNGILETNNLKYDSEKSITVGNVNHGYMTIPPGYDRWKLIFSIRAKKMRDTMALVLTRRAASDASKLQELINETKVSGLRITGVDDPF